MSTNLVYVSSGLVLRIKFHGPSDTRGARLVVSDVDRGRRVVVPYAYGLNEDQRRAEAVEAWAERHLGADFQASWVVGTLVSGSEWVAVSVPYGVAFWGWEA